MKFNAQGIAEFIRHTREGGYPEAFDRVPAYAEIMGF
jgi:hypothetical protein